MQGHQYLSVQFKVIIFMNLTKFLIFAKFCCRKDNRYIIHKLVLDLSTVCAYSQLETLRKSLPSITTYFLGECDPFHLRFHFHSIQLQWWLSETLLPRSDQTPELSETLLPRSDQTPELSEALLLRNNQTP